MKGIRFVLTVLLGTLVIVLPAGSETPADGEYFFKINKGIDVFGKVYREITANYVDEVDPERFMEAGIDGMLENLDPYTVYIAKEEGDEVELLTTGKYGGVGITIGQRDGLIQVITVMEGYSAQRAGIQPGDKIIEVDGVKIAEKKPDEVRALTRGTPGTTVKVMLDREGEPSPLAFELVREEIQIKNVTYSGFVEPGLGYIKLERFSRKAGEEVRQAIRDLTLKSELKGLVIDLRGNPGGLLDAAVEIVSKFVPRGSLIVSTKGRRSDADREYRSMEEPMLPAVPVVVLTDRNSASASEIVSGAIQDLDRGLVVGARTFGKGLVQTILPLSYGAQLKITTARYYTPSGRSIQEIDYLHRNTDGVFTSYADSLKKEFKTAGGRTVYEHGGITPDSTVTHADQGPMVRQLHRKSLFFKFANSYVIEHKLEKINGITDEMMSAFKSFLEKEKFDYQEETETKLKEMRELAGKLNYGQDIVADLDRLKEDLEKEKKRGFERYAAQIKREMEVELSARVRGEQGRIEASLHEDTQVNTALALLKNTAVYAKMLQE